MTVIVSKWLVSWTPAQAGTFKVEVMASNGIGSDTQNWNIEVSE